MFEFVKDFFSSRDAFARVVRAMALAVTAASAAGQLPIPPAYAWIPAVIGGLIAVGEKNKAQ